jgi:spore maturation protein CgeB
MTDDRLRILFVGQSWLGSCARSLREALSRRGDVELDEIDEDNWFTSPRQLWLRAIGRLTNPGYVAGFERAVLAKVAEFRPHLLMTYKGTHIRRSLIAGLKRAGVVTVNIYPDCSPHAHGAEHREAVGDYDLVISTKVYHPDAWNSVYGYSNPCVFVPQGYDPLLHLADSPPATSDYDLVTIATYRPEYGDLFAGLGERLNDPEIRVAIGGHGWEIMQSRLPGHWALLGGRTGRSYVSLLRKGRICIAPLTRHMIVDGAVQPGDVDTTRSYELAAAHCFFLHRRTEFAEQLYTPDEVPMFDDAAGLADLVRHYLGDDEARTKMAAAAHRRAVPAYSLDSRAAEIIGLLRSRWPQMIGDSRA